jgi:hypothetical protein
MKKFAEMKEKVKGFVNSHKPMLALAGTAIISLTGGYLIGITVQDHKDFTIIQDGVERAADMCASAGVRVHNDWIRENVPEAFKEITKFMKENPDKYDIRKRLLQQEHIRTLGDSVGKELSFELFK